LYNDIQGPLITAGFFYDIVLKLNNRIVKKYKFKSEYTRLIADVITPVSMYLKLRDKFAHSILLESSDYHSADNSFSYICCNPIASFTLKGDSVHILYPDGETVDSKLRERSEAVKMLTEFTQAFEVEGMGFNFIEHGMFGYMSYDAVESFEDINFRLEIDEDSIPQIHYTVYRNVIVVNHFKSELFIFDHQLSDDKGPGNISEISDIIKSRNFPVYKFKTYGKEESNFTDQEFHKIVKEGIRHCHLRDVFQIVL